MAKKQNEEVQSTRKNKLQQAEQFEMYKKLRKQGVLTRQEFHILCFDKGLNQNQNKHPWSPVYTAYDIEKNAKTGKKTLNVSVKQWSKFDK